jgi:sporulation protein YlmC with PRC-barrel domain
LNDAGAVIMDAAALRGLAVVELEGAERLGRVTEVLFETRPLRAAALVLRSGSVERTIAFSDVAELGRDAIIVRDRPRLEAAGKGPSYGPGLDAMSKHKVVDESGTYIGQVSRVAIDSTSGAVVEIDVRKGEVLGVGGEVQTLDAERILGVGEDLVTVRKGTATPAAGAGLEQVQGDGSPGDRSRS